MSATTAIIVSLVILMFLIICRILLGLHDEIVYIKTLINSLDCQLFKIANRVNDVAITADIVNKNVNTMMNEEEK